jgi:hypothetical protein
MNTETRVEQVEFCKALARQHMKKEVDAVISAKKEKVKVLRDPVWYYRLGPWPGGH